MGDIKLIESARLEAQSLLAFDPDGKKLPAIWKTVAEKEKLLHLE
jgi:hypothetical protein